MRRVGIGVGVVAALVVVVVVAELVHGSGKPRHTVAVTVGDRPVQITTGTTLGAVAARIGEHPRAGSLLAVDGKVLRAEAFPGGFTVDGRPATMHTRLLAGDRVMAVAGRDRTEGLKRTVVPEPMGVPSNPQFFVDRVPGRWVIVRGSVSHQLVSSRFQPTGAARPRRAVALTFDDGPSPEYTPRILARLAKLHVRATFFVIGYLVSEYPSLVRRESQMGMVIGNHSYNHPEVPPFDQLPLPLLRDEISLGTDALARLGVKTRLFGRPAAAPNLGSSIRRQRSGSGSFSGRSIRLTGSRALRQRKSPGGYWPASGPAPLSTCTMAAATVRPRSRRYRRSCTASARAASGSWRSSPAPDRSR